MENYKGTIIEESLADKGVLKDVAIESTRVSPVTEEHKTPWLKQWTLHTVIVPAEKAEEFAEKIMKALDSSHSHWYVDFKNSQKHFIVFDDQVFHINRVEEEYKKVTRHGLALGIPDYQLDFSESLG